MSEEQKSQQADDHVEDLDVEQSEAEEVKGGLTSRKAGGKQQEYLQVKLEDVQISSY
jgi:type VI protein secretion system component Hcp